MDCSLCYNSDYKVVFDVLGLSLDVRISFKRVRLVYLLRPSLTLIKSTIVRSCA